MKREKIVSVWVLVGIERLGRKVETDTLTLCRHIGTDKDILLAFLEEPDSFIPFLLVLSSMDTHGFNTCCMQEEKISISQCVIVSNCKTLDKF